MARNHARIVTAIWQEDDWRELTPMAQWAYMLALTQPGLTLCGVVSYTPRRWAKLAGDVTAKKIERAVNELERARYVIVDDDTQELFVRSFVKNDGILKSPNLVTGMWSAYRDVVSPRIREEFMKGLPEGFHIPFAKGLPEPARNPSRACAQDPQILLPSSADDDEGSLRREALERLARRERDLGPVGDRNAWVEKAMKNLRLEADARRELELSTAAKWGITLARAGFTGNDLIDQVSDRYGADRARRLATIAAARSYRATSVPA